MKSKNLLFVLAVGLMGLSSAVMSSCSDNETELVQNKPIDGISFSVTDVQNTVDSTSLPKTKALSVYETQTSKITGDDAEGLELVETTIEGVNPIYIPAATRGTVTTSLNFQGLNKPFSIFACKNGGPVANYLYNEKVNADGTMVNAVQWRKADAASLKFYAVHPAVDVANLTTVPGQNPIIKFAPNADAKQQTDLLVAKTNTLQYDDYVNQKVPIQFSHATTAIQFKIGNDLSYNQVVKKIEIVGVIGSGTYDVANGTWMLGTDKKSYTLELNPGFSTAQNPGVVMNGGDGVFFMIPQTLPNDAAVNIYFESGKRVHAKIGGNNKQWVQGTTRTYSISNSSDQSDRDIVFTVTPTTDLGDGTTVRQYNQLSVPFTVQSYSRLKGYANDSRDKKEPWEIVKYEYVDGNDPAMGVTTTKPSMLVSVTDRGNGSTAPQLCNLEFTNELTDFVAYRNKQLKDADEVTTRKDLSMVDGKQNTANCYIVSAPGKYKFPLFYGSSRVNDADATESFWNNNTGNEGMVLKHFKGGVDQGAGNYAIPYPDIHQWVDKATVLWESKPGLIKVTAIDRAGKAHGTLGGRNVYVEFEVPKDNIETGNAIIAVWKNNKVAWSWHIWITGKDVVGVKSGEFLREPLGFVPSKWKRTTYSDDRKIRLTFKQTRTGKEVKVTFTQKPYFEQAQGQAMFYQWGRKDPYWPGMNLTSSDRVYDGGITLAQSVQEPMKMGNRRAFYSALGTGPDGHEKWGSTWDWNNDPARECTYLNLWDANATGYMGDNTSTFVKTIYDPSPAGFHIPRAADFSKLTEGRRRAALRMGYMHPEGGEHGNIPVYQGNLHGYYWTSEKVYVLHHSTWMFAAVHAYAINDNDLEIQRNAQYYTDTRFGYNVLPIKQ